MTAKKTEPKGPLVGFAMWLIGVLLAIAVVAWFVAMIVGMVNLFPFGLIGILVLAAFGILIFVVLRDKLSDKEDDYYSKNVDQ